MLADHLRPAYQKNSFTFCETNALLIIYGIEIKTPAKHRGLQAGCFRHHTGGRIRFPADKRYIPADNSGFFPPDTLAVIAKILLVVEPDGRNDGAVCIQDIHRIQASTQADFHDGKIQASHVHQGNCRQGPELEVTQADITPGRFDSFKSSHQLPV